VKQTNVVEYDARVVKKQNRVMQKPKSVLEYPKIAAFCTQNNNTGDKNKPENPV